MSLALTDLAKVKEFVKVTGSANDPTLNSLITLVSGSVERAMNRYTESKSRTKVLDVEAEQTVFSLKGFPITSVTSIKFDRQQDFAGTDTMTADEYVFPDDRGYIETRWPLIPQWGGTAPQALQIVYTGGLAANLTALRAHEEFHAIEDLVLMFIQRRYKRQRTTPDKISLSGQKGGASFPSMALSTEERMMLAQWTRRNG